MGKGFIYVFLVFVTVLLVFALYMAAQHEIAELFEKRRQLRHRRLRRDTPWEPFLNVESGEIVLGVERAASFEGTDEIYEAEQMYRVPSNHDPVDVQLKLGEARDRASLYNALREEKRHERPVD